MVQARRAVRMQMVRRTGAGFREITGHITTRQAEQTVWGWLGASSDKELQGGNKVQPGADVGEGRGAVSKPTQGIAIRHFSVSWSPNPNHFRQKMNSQTEEKKD